MFSQRSLSLLNTLALAGPYGRLAGHGSTINAQISRRQKFLQEVRGVLDDAATQFVALGESRAYKGDSYPAGIDRLAALLQSYHSPEDAVRQAVDSLKADYGVTGAAGGV